MADYKELTGTQKAMLVGKTYHMWRDGSTNAEIAECLKRPIEEVNEWVEICKIAFTKLTPEEDEKVLAIMRKERVP